MSGQAESDLPETVANARVQLPSLSDLRALKTARPVRLGVERRSFRLVTRVVTPILGGAYATRALDDVDIIRPPTIRGQLRFWWRAVYGHECSSPQELYAREARLWGGATDEAAGRGAGRSLVEVSVSPIDKGSVDESQVELFGRDATPGAYALWPARGERGERPVPRREGAQFELTVSGPVSSELELELRNAVRAWLIFGGYGGRTRRGLGSLAVKGNAKEWLPTIKAVADLGPALASLFGRAVLAPAAVPAGDVPWLAGAALCAAEPLRDAGEAWVVALDWLKEFRQGPESGARQRPPPTAPMRERPGRSNWPEPDKIRHLSGAPAGGWAHEPVHNGKPVWPRAGFGLPILGQFQTQGRDKKRYGKPEPPPFRLYWQRGDELHDRLASPLIVKALPLADGSFVPCALWLHRALPANARVGLARGNGLQRESAVPFDGQLVAGGDSARFSALAGKTSLRQAFVDWLKIKKKTMVVAP